MPPCAGSYPSLRSSRRAAWCGATAPATEMWLGLLTAPRPGAGHGSCESRGDFTIIEVEPVSWPGDHPGGRGGGLVPDSCQIGCRTTATDGGRRARSNPHRPRSGAVPGSPGPAGTSRGTALRPLAAGFSISQVADSADFWNPAGCRCGRPPGRAAGPAARAHRPCCRGDLLELVRPGWSPATPTGGHPGLDRRAGPHGPIPARRFRPRPHSRRAADHRPARLPDPRTGPARPHTARLAHRARARTSTIPPCRTGRPRTST